MTSADVRGRFLWYDLMTTDVPAAQAFYRSVAGWGVETWDAGEKPYPMWTVGERPIGGAMDLPAEAREAGAPPHWLAYVGVPDVDATTAQAAGLGATVLVAPMDIPTVGRFAVLCDPDGAVFAVFRPEGDMSGHGGAPAVGDVSWRELIADDYAEAFAFYRELFGWEVAEDMEMGADGIYRIYGAGGPPLGGMMNKEPGMPVGAWLFYVRTDDLDAVLERVRAGGGEVLNGPMDVPGGGRIAQCRDPQGAAFALHEVGGAA
ncbi:MAG: VOC family protein [Gemmatimonadota bacterium]